MRTWLWVPAIVVCLTTLARAETVHLNSGETVTGRIVRVDEQTLSIESDKGFGVLQIDRGDIALIEFDETERDPSGRVGVGYVHRSTPSSVGAQAAEYGTDSLSLKMWLNEHESVDLLVGFYSASVSDEEILEVFTIDLRFASVFSRRANLDLYWGVSVGYLDVTDRTAGRDFSDSGSRFSFFLGSELFFATLPDLGFSAEIGVGGQSVGEREVTNISTTTFPTFSLRYYY